MVSLVGKNRFLNADGLVFFSFQKFIVVLEVPADHSGLCFIYTMVCHVSPEDDQLELLKTAMELNYMQSATRGASLGLNGEEVNLCYSCPITGLSFCDLETALQDFLITAAQVNEQLESVKKRCRGRSRSSG
jgi:hypothetical protein